MPHARHQLELQPTQLSAEGPANKAIAAGAGLPDRLRQGARGARAGPRGAREQLPAVERQIDVLGWLFDLLMCDRLSNRLRVVKLTAWCH